jgi:hypothetical protein
MDASLKDAVTPCPGCHRDVPLTVDICPHCGTSANTTTPLLSFHYPGGGGGMIDQLTVSFLRSKLGDPIPDDLEDLLKRTTCIRVSELIVREGRGRFEPVLEFSSAADLAEFRNVLRVRSESRGHLMAMESHHIECLSGEHLLATLQLVGPGVLRWPDRWQSDAALVDQDALADFFKSHGYPQLRSTLDQAREQAARREVDVAAWRRTWEAAAPAGLLPLVEELDHNCYAPTSPGRDKALQILSNQDPTPEAQALTLFRWFGHSLGPWSGFPSSEMAPKSLLEMLPHEVLIAALRRDDLTVQQKEGAARFFCWVSWERRSKNVPEIPADIRQRLWEYVQATGNEDKIRQASRVLGDQRP